MLNSTQSITPMVAVREAISITIPSIPLGRVGIKSPLIMAGMSMPVTQSTAPNTTSMIPIKIFMAFSTMRTPFGLSPDPYIRDKGTETATRRIQLMFLGTLIFTMENRAVTASAPRAYCPKLYTMEAMKQAIKPVARLPKNLPWNLS